MTTFCIAFCQSYLPTGKLFTWSHFKALRWQHFALVSVLLISPWVYVSPDVDSPPLNTQQHTSRPTLVKTFNWRRQLRLFSTSLSFPSWWIYLKWIITPWWHGWPPVKVHMDDAKNDVVTPSSRWCQRSGAALIWMAGLPQSSQIGNPMFCFCLHERTHAGFPHC